MIAVRKGWLYQSILETIASSRYREKVILLDYVSDIDLNVLYHQAVMFVSRRFMKDMATPW